MREKTLAIDFDGVIHKYSKGWMDSSIYDDPVDGAKEKMEELVSRGYRLIIFTVRLNPLVNEEPNLERNKMNKWLFDHGFIEGVHYHEITAVKPAADVYIDDKAIRFTNWDEVMKVVE
ncbi:MAG TPA: hypothetical protein VLH94_04475 [Spirochaetia bacterium]|nr:hypothetical protein [Spirochaetia bacterium]